MSGCPATVIVQQNTNQVVQQVTRVPVEQTVTQDTVEQIDLTSQTVTVVERENVEQINDAVRTIEIDVPGLPGPAGPVGPSAAGVAPINFTFDDSSGNVFTSSEDGTIVAARILILTAFDGSNPSLSLGTLSQPNAILSSTQNDPSVTEEYENTPDFALSAGQSVFFTIVPGAGASQGNGTIYLVFLPN